MRDYQDIFWQTIDNQLVYPSKSNLVAATIARMNGVSGKTIMFDDSETLWNVNTLRKTFDLVKISAKADSFLVSDKDYPHLTLKIVEIGYEKNHPRNPNPAAGDAKRYYVTLNDKKIGQLLNSKKSATKVAQGILKNMIAKEKAKVAEAEAKIVADRLRLYQANPKYGKF